MRVHWLAVWWLSGVDMVCRIWRHVGMNVATVWQLCGDIAGFNVGSVCDQRGIEADPRWHQCDIKVTSKWHQGGIALQEPSRSCGIDLLTNDALR